MTVSKTIQVEPNADALCTAVIKFLADAKAAVVAGGAVAEVVKIGGALVADIFPVLSAVGQLPAEEKDNVYAFARTFTAAAPDFAKAVLA